MKFEYSFAALGAKSGYVYPVDEETSTIYVSCKDGVAHIKANQGGLRRLAKMIVKLASPGWYDRYHIDLYPDSELTCDSIQLVIERDDSFKDWPDEADKMFHYEPWKNYSE